MSCMHVVIREKRREAYSSIKTNKKDKGGREAKVLAKKDFAVVITIDFLS